MKLKRPLPRRAFRLAPRKTAAGFPVLLCGALLALSAPALSAATLYEDGFDYAASTSLMGQTGVSGATALAGNAWTRVAGSYAATIQPTGQVTLGVDVGAALAFGSDTGYSLDRYVSLSLAFREGDLWDGVSEATAKGIASYPYAGVSLGFWTAAEGGGGVFSGVAVDRYGNIKVSSGGVLLAEVDAAPSLGGSTLYTLSYVVDTQSGSISSIALSDGGGTIYEGSFPSVTAFTGANLNLVGFRGKGNASTQTASVESFSVTSIPETSTTAGVFGAVALLACLVGRNARRVG